MGRTKDLGQEKTSLIDIKQNEKRLEEFLGSDALISYQIIDMGEASLPECPDLDMYKLLTKAICNAEMSENSAEFEIEYNYLQLAEKLLRIMKKEKLNYLKKKKNETTTD